MRRLAVVLFTMMVLIPNLALADGMMLPDRDTYQSLREKGLIKEPEQKAVIYFNNGVEQLIISPSYEGQVEKFVWIVPVPAKPDIEITEAAIFDELMDFTGPHMMSIPAPAATKNDSRSEIKVLERKTVGAYDVSVLSADDSDTLM